MAKFKDNDYCTVDAGEFFAEAFALYYAITSDSAKMSQYREVCPKTVNMVETAVDCVEQYYIKGIYIDCVSL